MAISVVPMREETPSSTEGLWRGVAPGDGFVRASCTAVALDGFDLSDSSGLGLKVYQTEVFASAYAITGGRQGLRTAWLPAVEGQIIEVSSEWRFGKRVWLSNVEVVFVSDVSSGSAPEFGAVTLVNETTGANAGGTVDQGGKLRCLVTGLEGSPPITLTYEFFHVGSSANAIQSGLAATYVPTFLDTDKTIACIATAQSPSGSNAVTADGAYLVNPAPASIVSLSGFSLDPVNGLPRASWLHDQPSTSEKSWFVFGGSAPLATAWEWRQPGGGWELQNWTSLDLFAILPGENVVPGTHEFRLTVSNSLGSETSELITVVSEAPSAEVVASWFDAIFDAGLVTESDGVYFVGGVTQGVHPTPGYDKVHGTLAAPVGTLWRLEVAATDGGAFVAPAVNWSSTTSTPFAINYAVQYAAADPDGVVWYRFVADVGDGSFVYSDVIRVENHELDTDTVAPVVTIDPVVDGPGPFAFTGTVSDDVGVTSTVLKVWDGGTLVTEIAAVVIGGLWSATWMPSSTATGLTAQIIAGDAAGNSTPATDTFDVTAAATSHVFDDGSPGVFGDAAGRSGWWWNIVTGYFEPRHSLSSAAPVRQLWVSPSGAGNGLSSGAPTTLLKYLTNSGITRAPGDQVRLKAGTHNAGAQACVVQGTAANPIRFIRDDLAVMPKVVNSSGGGGQSTWRFSDSFYVGVHGIEVDSNSADTWGLTFGRRHSDGAGDTGMVRCHHIDIWHVDSHHPLQETFKIAGTQGTGGGTTNGAEGPSSYIHFFGTDAHDSGTSGALDYSEMFYFGDGNTSGDHVSNAAVEACRGWASPAGEAVDFKGASSNNPVVSCLFNDISVRSQGAIMAWDAPLTIRHCVIWNVRETVGVSSYDAYAIFAPHGDIEDVVCWDLGGSAVGYSSRGGSFSLNRVTTWNTRLDNGSHSTDLLHFDTNHVSGGLPTVTVANCVSEDGTLLSRTEVSGNVTTISAGSFVGPVTGTAEATSGEPGSGFALVSGSTSLGAQGL